MADGGVRSERNIRWIEQYCRVPEGKFVGQRVVLREFQRRAIRMIYDEDVPVRTAILSFGRKNAKTALVAFIVLLHLVGPEAKANSAIVSAARSRDQAAQVFNYASKCVRMNPDLDAAVTIRDTAKELLCSELGTFYKALSAEAKTQLGRSPILVIHDELGQVVGPRDELYEALDTAQGAHEQPLSIIISTQAPTDADLLSILIDNALLGTDPTVRVMLFTAPLEADPFTDEALKAANPAFGDFLNADECRRLAKQAKEMPSREAAFRNLILNQRVNADSPLLSRTIWESLKADYRLDDFEGEPCWVGLDLSATTDTTAMVLVFKRDGKLWSWPFFWLPAEGLAEKALHDRVPYDLWAKQKHLFTTPGRSIDMLYVAKQAAAIAQRFKVQTVAFDRMFFKFLQPQLEREGVNLPLKEFGQGFLSMAPAVNALEAAALNDELRHPGHPVLTSHAANAIVLTDPAGNRKLDKAKSTGRIDGMVALTMAVRVATEHVDLGNIYERKEVLVL